MPSWPSDFHFLKELMLLWYCLRHSTEDMLYVNLSVLLHSDLEFCGF